MRLPSARDDSRKELPMDWIISFLAIGVVALGAGFDRRRQRERARLARPEINRWEEEGGAVSAAAPVVHSPDSGRRGDH
jgi:hypothetical protein